MRVNTWRWQTVALGRSGQGRAVVLWRQQPSTHHPRGHHIATIASDRLLRCIREAKAHLRSQAELPRQVCPAPASVTESMEPNDQRPHRLALLMCCGALANSSIHAHIAQALSITERRDDAVRRPPNAHLVNAAGCIQAAARWRTEAAMVPVLPLARVAASFNRRHRTRAGERRTSLDDPAYCPEAKAIVHCGGGCCRL